MFETLDEQIKQTETETVSKSTTALRSAAVVVITLLIFCGLYMAMMFLEY